MALRRCLPAVPVYAIGRCFLFMAETNSPLPSGTTPATQVELARVREALRVSEVSRLESRTFFEKSFHASPALMTIANVADGRLIEVNPAFLRESGFTRDEVIGRSTLELGVWANVAERDEFLRRMHQQGCVRDFEANFRSKSGEVRSFLLHADLLEMGGPACMMTVGVDISERRRREQVQDATYQISRAVLAGGDLKALFTEVHRIIGALMPARNFYIALVSPDGTEISFPYFVDEIVPPPGPRALANGFTEYVLQSGRPLLAKANELPGVLSTRGAYHVLDRPAAQRLGAPLMLAGKAIGVIALQDYHNADAFDDDDLRLLNFVAEQTAVAVQRRQAEDALKSAEERYRGIFENALEGLYLSSPSGEFISVNTTLANMLGYASPAALLVDINDIGRQIYVRQGRRAEFFELIKQADEVTDFESEVVRRDGKTLWISESVRVVRNAAGEVDHFEGVAIDVTLRRETAAAMQRAKEAADAASRAKSYFLASVSHELRTPLNGILGYTQILRRDPALSEKQREGVRVIHESADHLLALINDVLDLSKIEAGRIDLHPADLDLIGFAEGVERVFAPRARDKGILLKTDLAPELPRWVQGDEQRLKQIVYNLVANAVKFTNRGGVVFSVHAEPENVIRFSVSDSGPGISAADIAKLFEPFSQVGEHTGTGTGLGLAISRSLVERMKGKLHVESNPGWGSRFWFDVTLPVASGAFPAAPQSSGRRVTGYEGPRRRVLLVDDNATNRAVLVDMLTPLDFVLAEAVDGASALSEAEHFLPDLVLMDLRLPGIDGLTATRRLRAGPRSAAMKIIAVSASAYDVDRSECLAAGCDAFLAKPFREEELWGAIERVLGLTWRYVDSEETRTPFNLTVHAPPADEAMAIYELAAKGDVVAIRARAQALVERDPKYEAFAQSVLDLAGRFKMKAIRQFVGRYISEQPSSIS
ncbi:MAG: PAS domain S-box protein [Opitutus sp.]